MDSRQVESEIYTLRERERHTHARCERGKEQDREIEQDRETKQEKKGQRQKRESEPNRETQKTAYKRSGRDRD